MTGTLCRFEGDVSPSFGKPDAILSRALERFALRLRITVAPRGNDGLARPSLGVLLPPRFHGTAGLVGAASHARGGDAFFS